MAAEAEAQAHPRPQRQAQKKGPEPSGDEEEEEEEKKAMTRQLRRLEFARVAAARAVVCLAGLYGLAKGRAGSALRPTVDAVESAVACVFVPLYDRFCDALLALLVFLDRKVENPRFSRFAVWVSAEHCFDVDDMVRALDRKLPRSLKAALSRSCTAARDVPRVARQVLAEARRSGVAAAGRAAYVKMEPAAKCLYMRYGPAAGRLAVSTWRSLNRLPLFPQVARLIARFFRGRGVEVDAR